MHSPIRCPNRVHNHQPRQTTPGKPAVAKGRILVFKQAIGKALSPLASKNDQSKALPKSVTPDTTEWSSSEREGTPGSASQQGGKKYEWTKAWYPVGLYRRARGRVWRSCRVHAQVCISPFQTCSRSSICQCQIKCT